MSRSPPSSRSAWRPAVRFHHGFSLPSRFWAQRAARPFALVLSQRPRMLWDRNDCLPESDRRLPRRDVLWADRGRHDLLSFMNPAMPSVALTPVRRGAAVMTAECGGPTRPDQTASWAPWHRNRLASRPVPISRISPPLLGMRLATRCASAGSSVSRCALGSRWG